MGRAVGLNSACEGQREWGARPSFFTRGFPTGWEKNSDLSWCPVGYNDKKGHQTTTRAEWPSPPCQLRWWGAHRVGRSNRAIPGLVKGPDRQPGPSFSMAKLAKRLLPCCLQRFHGREVHAWEGLSEAVAEPGPGLSPAVTTAPCCSRPACASVRSIRRLSKPAGNHFPLPLSTAPNLMGHCSLV